MTTQTGFRGNGVADLKGLEEAMLGRRPAWVDDKGTIHVGERGGAPPPADSGVTTFRPTTWGAGALIPASWFELLPGRNRDEQNDMLHHHPKMRLVKNDDGSLSWIGPLFPFPGEQLVVELRYPECYPAEAPSAYILSPKLEPSPHQFGDGHLCLMYLSQEERRDQMGAVAPTRTWLPSCTARTLVPLVSMWYGAYVVHRNTCREANGRPCTSNRCAHWAGQKHAGSEIVA